MSDIHVGCFGQEALVIAHSLQGTTDSNVSDGVDNANTSQSLIPRNLRACKSSTNVVKSPPLKQKRRSEPLKLENRVNSKDSISLCAVKQIKDAVSVPSGNAISVPSGNAISVPSGNGCLNCDVNVQRWLEGLNLKYPDKYTNLFAKHEFDMIGVRFLTDNQLRKMGIKAFGVRNKILQGVEILNGPGRSSSSAQNDHLPTTRSKTSTTKLTKKKKFGVGKDVNVKTVSRVDVDDLDHIPIREPKPVREPKAVSVPNPIREPKPVKPIECRPTFASARSPTTIAKTGIKQKRKNVNVKKHERKTPELKTQRMMPLEKCGDSDGTRCVRPTDNPRHSADKEQETSDPVLVELTVQVQKLLKNHGGGDSKTVKMIGRLQQQLQAIGSQIAVRKNCAIPLNPTNAQADTSKNIDQNKQNYKSMNYQPSAVISPHSGHSSSVHTEQNLRVPRPQRLTRSCELLLDDIKYDDRDLVGEGHFTKVYFGMYQSAEVALKKLKRPLSQLDWNYFAAEVSLLRGLRHASVVQLLGACTDTTFPVMVLEFMAVGSLYSVLHGEGMPPLDHVVYYQLATNIAQGMNYLHLHRPSILHLHLKSVNVLIDARGQAKVANFGFSKLRHEADVAAAGRRTRSPNSVEAKARQWPAWMAPELLSAKPVTLKADVYSYGIILWEMVTRHDPFHGLSTFTIIERVRQGQRPTIPDHASPRLAMLIKQCWQHNAIKRPMFKDIVSILSDLQLPRQWRHLLDEAAVPHDVIESSQSVRQIIDYVNLTLDSMQDPSMDLSTVSSDLKLEDFTYDDFMLVDSLPSGGNCIMPVSGNILTDVNGNGNMPSDVNGNGNMPVPVTSGKLLTVSFADKISNLKMSGGQTSNIKQCLRTTNKSEFTQTLSENPDAYEARMPEGLSLTPPESYVVPPHQTQLGENAPHIPPSRRTFLPEKTMAPSFSPSVSPSVSPVPSNMPPCVSVVPSTTHVTTDSPSCLRIGGQPGGPPGGLPGHLKKNVRCAENVAEVKLSGGSPVNSAHVQSHLHSPLPPSHPIQVHLSLPPPHPFKHIPEQRLNDIADILRTAIASRLLILRDGNLKDEPTPETDEWLRRCSLLSSFRQSANSNTRELVSKCHSADRVSDQEGDKIN